MRRLKTPLEEATFLLRLPRTPVSPSFLDDHPGHQAAEIKALGHGAFTYTLLEALKGTAGMKKVLIHYVKEKLPELMEKHRGQAQYPVSWGSGMDFPLALH